MADVVVDLENSNPKELLGQGIRAYILQDYNSAVNALSKATELLVTEHGDDCHDSLGDAYLYYGKALLALSREENEPLGSAIPKGDEEESDEEDEEAEATNEIIDKSDSGTTEKSEAKSEEKEKTEENTKGDSEEDSKQVEADTTNEKLEENEEATDLQVAWEILELAKKIFQKRGDEGKKQLADTLIVLGEVSLESENFESAVNDIKEGLEIQKKLFEDDSRTIAETLYKLGVAYSTSSQINEAIDSFKESERYLENRIKALEKTEKDEHKEEIEEIKGLIPDIEEKISDMKAYKDETLKKMMSTLTDSCNGGASSSKQASDISHLVKRKRKEDTESEEVPAKKPSP